MYPAQAFHDGLFTADDLPDQFEMNYDGTIYVMQKNGSRYISGGMPYYVEVGEANVGSGIWQWLIYDSGFPDFYWDIFGDCLFSDTSDRGIDQFASSYNVEMAMFNDYVRGSCVVNNTSLGTWEGIAYNVGAGTWPEEYYFDGASVDLRVKLTICNSMIWVLQYEPIGFYCDNLNPELGYTCEQAILVSGPGPFLSSAHYKFSENYGQEGQFQSSPNQGNGLYAFDQNYYMELYGGLPLFGSKIS